MRGMIPAAVIVVAAVATAGVALSVVTARDGAVQLQPDGVVVTPSPAAGVTPSGSDPTAPGVDAGAEGSPAAGQGSPTGSTGARGGQETEPPADGIQTVPPAPARTVPSQAATGRPSAPGHSEEHKPSP